MKILQITAVDFTLKKFVIPLIDILQNDGHEVHAACSFGIYSSELLKEGYTLHNIPFKRNVNLFDHLKSLMLLVKLLKKEKYDIVHAHTPIASLIGRVAAKLAKVPVTIYTAHGFYFHEHMSSLPYNVAYMLEKIWAKLFTDHLFFVSKEDHEFAMDKNFKNKERLFYIGNGVKADRFNLALFDRKKLRRQEGIKENERVFIFVGRLVKEKGLGELIEAFRLIHDRQPNIKLVIVGGKVEGDRDSFDIQETISKLPLSISQNIICTGLRDDIANLLSIADVFILPSYREGLPVSIIEAMAMNLPVIATNIRGCREEVVNGYNGFLCHPKDAVDLASKMEKVLSCDMEKMGQNSKNKFLSEYDEQLVLKRQRDYFRKIALGTKLEKEKVHYEKSS